MNAGRYLFVLLVGVVLYGHDAPYSLKKFRPALDGAKLQAPKSSFDPRYSIDYGAFAYRANRYFFLQDRRYMGFLMCGAKNRSELRRKNEWPVTTKKAKKMAAKLHPIPLGAKREFTFLQIHDTGTSANKPLLRINWRKEYRKKKGHLWAMIRLSDSRGDSEYQKVDLGPSPVGQKWAKIKVEVKDGWMSIWRDGKRYVRKDVRYWRSGRNYFKAGVYLQDEGCAEVLFEKLEFAD
jgi:hypothetical protein